MKNRKTSGDTSQCDARDFHEIVWREARKACRRHRLSEPEAYHDLPMIRVLGVGLRITHDRVGALELQLWSYANHGRNPRYEIDFRTPDSLAGLHRQIDWFLENPQYRASSMILKD